MELVNTAQCRMTVSFWFFALAAAGVLAGQDIFGLLLGAAIHEGGHLAAMAACGGRVDRFEVGAFGAKILPRYPGIPSVARELGVLFAGPAAGLAAAGLVLVLGYRRFAVINCFLSCFNLLPLPGLDGGSILSLLLSARLGEEGEQAARAIGLAFSSLLLLGLVFLLIRSAAT